MGAYTSDNALREKVVWQANGRRLSAEIFDGENFDELIKICQIRQYFPPSKFCVIRYISASNEDSLLINSTAKAIQLHLVIVNL